MTFHQGLVIYSGLAFFTAGLFTLGIWRMLSPHDKDRMTVGAPLRAIIFVHAVVCIARGVTLIFPGQLIHVDAVSPMVPLAASTTLLVAAAVAELLQSYRLPPPLMERFVRAFHAFRHDSGDSLVEAAFAVPLAPLGERPAAEAAVVRLSNPRLRALVLASASLGLLILLCVVLRAAAAPLPPAGKGEVSRETSTKSHGSPPVLICASEARTCTPPFPLYMQGLRRVRGRARVHSSVGRAADS